MNRHNYVIARRNIRLDVKNHIKMQVNNPELTLLKIYGSPIFMPLAIDSEAYQNSNLLDFIEKGFYFDYDSYDSYEVKKLYPQFGA